MEVVHTLKRPADETLQPANDTSAQLVHPPLQQQAAASGAALDDDDTADEVQVSKRQKAGTSTAAIALDGDSSNGLSGHTPAAPHQQDRTHLRKHHALDSDDAEAGADGVTAVRQGLQHSGQQPEPEQQHDQEHQNIDKHGSHHKQKRSKQSGKQHLLSFEGDEEEGEQLDLPAAAAAEGGLPGAAVVVSSRDGQQQGRGMGHATAAKFKADARQAAAARFTFSPSHAGDQLLQAQLRIGIVDEDDSLLKRKAPAGLSQVHFGMAQARGARPYMEDRHCIVTALKPSTTHQDSSALLFLDDCSSSPQQVLAEQPQQPAIPSSLQDGVERCYAAIFDGHNGAGAAETAARQLHLLLAGHPALKIFKGDPGPPAVVKQEEAAVGKALKSAFRQVDDLVLAVSRRAGTRDGATALVVLRLGGALYSAHAGDSRAVLCRDGEAHRLTEDHKPHLPQERQRIEEAGGRVDFQRCWRVVVEPRDGRPGSGLAVSRSLGDLDFKEPARFVECEPDVTRLALQPHKDSFVILGSDGLWDVLSDTDAVLTAAAALKAYSDEHKRCSNHTLASAAAVQSATQLYKQHDVAAFTAGGHARGPDGSGLPDQLVYSDGAATAAAEALLAESMRRGTMDNVTVIVMLLQWE